MVQRKPTPHRPIVLLTGFDPFGADTINPSWLAVKALHGRQIMGHSIVAAQLPTVFGASLQTLRRSGRRTQCPVARERVAININDARIADNAAAQPVDTPVIPDGPAAYFSTLPIKSMLVALQREGVAAEVSQTAGTFVCNHVFYGLMHALATQRGLRRVRGGFIHVPWLPEQGSPAMALDDMARGLKLAVRTALVTSRDATMGAGALN